MKDLGVLSWFLGTEFNCSEGLITISQKQHIGKLLTKFGMIECKPKATPVASSQEKFPDTESPKLTDPTLYRAIVGSLIYRVYQKNVPNTKSLLNWFICKITDTNSNQWLI